MRKSAHYTFSHRLLFAVGVLLTLIAEVDAEQTLNADDMDFFESKIRPLLIEHCYECHSEASGEASGGLRLDTASSVRGGGASGPGLVPGNVDDSLLIRAVRYKDSQYQMPPSGKLPDESIRLLEQWVQRGAPDPRDADPSEPTKSFQRDIDPSSHWAFVPPQRYRVPSAKLHPNDHDVIDGIARRLASENDIAVAEPVSDRRLMRRLYHDLTGLPPTAEQLATFADSKQSDKVERLVDRLLATPAYAERLTRHWMDIARYADTIGYATAGKERRLTGSERYRDWLIKAFARDMPFDEMIRLQLAGDRIDPDNEAGNLDAMGFLTIGRRFLNRYDTLDDRIDVITRGLMGLTVACARCHDHKFDPIPTADYYSLLGILQSSQEPKDGASPLMMVDKPKPKDSAIFVRGQPGNRGDIVPRQYFTALRDPGEGRFTDGSGRWELANRLAAPDNPLVSRVFVNRIWAYLIGRPIIESTSDFGVRTDATVLVPVLDELSADFTEHWSVKRLVRRIVTSRIYAQSTTPGNSDALTLDPENRFAARGNRKRRDFESMRDSMLSVCGMLDRKVGGSPVEIHLNSPVPRRTLYAMIDRQNLPALFRTFDFANPDAHAPKRYFTTVPQQALFLMNHPQMGAIAEQLATRIQRNKQSTDDNVRQLFETILARSPGEAELKDCIDFLSEPSQPRRVQFDPKRAWRYGTSPVNPKSEVTAFQPFPVFSGSSWQDGPELPADTQLRYASLGEENGHPGPRHAVVRRWIAPEDGEISISGMVGHRNKQGDGVELAIWIGGRRVWRENQKSNNRPFRNIQGPIQKGQPVDFVVSPRQSASFDSFFLRCQVSLDAVDGEFYEGDSRRDFAGPLPQTDATSLGRFAQLAQTLLLSNEFLFVD